ncbi:hypothetical protein LMG27174_03218 [Paraburkholderia rhynchosiae]|uniref:Uncharacterized protein n=2 Tax=Paraburkholderia rhynchosiae TaxID=487049 RepID=A0A2N7WLR2_9BURK|nr:hypothetical protein C0Z16_15555 [Paraburkholderia rhynchosiae]CAB3691995.1 hypothetical protein LMG27174_03218 [Paraburkholderia rhynchosiae]
MKKRLMQPLLPWRCVGWSDLTVNFFVVASAGGEDCASPDGWVVDGAEALIELVLQLGDVSFSVHLLARGDADASVTLCRVSGLWQEVQAEDSDVVHYWYSTTDGETRRCSPAASGRRVKRPRLVKVLSFENG